MKKPSKPILRNFNNHHIVIVLALLVKKDTIAKITTLYLEMYIIG